LQLELPLVGPLGAAVAVDAIAHSIPGLNVLFALLSEPCGAAAGALVLLAPAHVPASLMHILVAHNYPVEGTL